MLCCNVQVMWSIGVTALLVSSVLLTALIAWMDHFDMPTVEEEAATHEVLQRLTSQQPEAGLEDGDTRLTMQRSAATTLSGIMSPFREQQGSSHPPPSGSTAVGNTPREVAVITQPSRPSAAQVGLQAALAPCVELVSCMLLHHTLSDICKSFCRNLCVLSCIMRFQAATDCYRSQAEVVRRLSIAHVRVSVLLCCPCRGWIICISTAWFEECR